MTSVLAFPLATALSVDPWAERGSLAIKLPSAFSAADLIPKTRCHVLHQPAQRIPLMLPWLGETSALFTLGAAQRPLKASPLLPQPTAGGAACTGRALDLLTPSTPTWPLVIQQGRGHSHHQGTGEGLGGSKEGGFLQARSASLRGEFLLSLTEDDQNDWK